MSITVITKASHNLISDCVKKMQKVKQSRYTPWRRLGGEEVWLLLIHDLGIRWG
jgi:hypothetical protein